MSSVSPVDNSQGIQSTIRGRVQAWTLALSIVLFLAISRLTNYQTGGIFVFSACLLLMILPQALLPAGMLFFSDATMNPEFESALIVGPVNFQTVETTSTILLLVILIVGRFQTIRYLWRMPLVKPLTTLFIWILLVTAWQTKNGVGSMEHAIYNLRNYFQYTPFYLLILLVGNKKRLVWAAYGIFGMFLLQLFIHYRFEFFPDAWLNEFIGYTRTTNEGSTNLLRVLSRGSFFLFLCFCPILFMTLSKNPPLPKWLLWCITLLAAGAMLFTQVRAYWIPILLAVSTFWLFLPKEQRVLPMLRTISAGVIGIVFLLGFLMLGLDQSAISSMIARGSDVAEHGLKTPTLLYRGLELIRIWPVAKKHLIIGNGAGVYVEISSRESAISGKEKTQKHSETHLQYFTVLLHAGVIGVAIWLWLWISLIYYAGRLTKLVSTDWERMLWIGVTYSGIGSMLGMLVQGNGWMSFTIPPLVTLMTFTSIRYVQVRYQVEDTVDWALGGEKAAWIVPDLPPIHVITNYLVPTPTTNRNQD